MKPTNTERLLDGDLHIRAAELLGFIARAPDDGQHHPLDAQEAVDVMLVALATLIEGTETVKTPRDFRQAAELYGSEMLTVARTLRKWFDADGLHHYERMGGYRSGAAAGRKLGPTN